MASQPTTASTDATQAMPSAASLQSSNMPPSLQPSGTSIAASRCAAVTACWQTLIYISSDPASSAHRFTHLPTPQRCVVQPNRSLITQHSPFQSQQLGSLHVRPCFPSFFPSDHRVHIDLHNAWNCPLTRLRRTTTSYSPLGPTYAHRPQPQSSYAHAS